MVERLSLASLADWAEGRLDPEEGEQIEHAIADDPDTASAAAWVVDLLEVSGRLPLEEPPTELHGRLRALFDRDEDPR